ncbi:sugar ABC transporter substrate-binding protein [Cohnella soli]|uniref:Sugar ABC transporter substrate-binding protein n=1 Tax=Cohnella soli TaxID=425005 RepID=A0ABW0HKZ7_9BACL
MKKQTRVVWIAAVLALAAVLSAMYLLGRLASGTGSSPSTPVSSPAPDEGRRIKIGFANFTNDVQFPQQVKQSIEQEAKKHGIELVTADNRLDGATALRNAERFMTEGVDLVIEFQIDERYGNIIMDRLRLAGIPVIAIDIPMPGAIFFGADNYRAGYMAGTALGNAIKSKWQGKLDRLFMLELPQAGPIPAARMQGQRDGLESIIGAVPEDRVLHLDSKSTFDESKRLVEEELKKLSPGLKLAFVNMNDDTALGSLKAVQDAGRAGDSLIVGQNGTEPFLKELYKDNATLVGSTAYFPEKYGEKLIPAALMMLKGQPVPPYLFTNHVFIDKNNVGQYILRDK